MYCLHCGDCCRRMSPITGGDRECPHLIQEDDFYFCAIQSRKPKECSNHDFPARVCPIGIDILSIATVEDVHKRIDSGYEKIKLLGEGDESCQI